MHLRSFQARALYVGALRGESVTKKGVPLAPRGVPWAAQGHILGFGPKMDLQFRANGSHVCNLSTKVGLAELIRRKPRQAAAIPLSPQSGARAAAPNPTSRAGGQDDVSLEQTPSNQVSGIRYRYQVSSIRHQASGIRYQVYQASGKHLGASGKHLGCIWEASGRHLGAGMARRRP